MIYLDSNVFLYALLYDDARGRACQRLLEAVHGAHRAACTSVLTWDEVVYVLQRAVGRDAALSRGEDFLRFPHLTLVECTPGVLGEANSLCRKLGLNPRDGIHAASARAARAAEFVSEDEDFRRLPGLRWRRPAEVG